MNSNLLTFVKYEEQLIAELVTLAEKQQSALTRYDLGGLQEIAAYQEQLAKSLKEAEDKRIKYFMSWLGISRKDAGDVTLSSLEEKCQPEEATEFGKIRSSLKLLISRLNNLNTVNRVLANRARNSVGEILTILTNGANSVCNVKV